MDDVKRTIVDLVKTCVHLTPSRIDDLVLHVFGEGPTWILVSVDTPAGPRQFEIRVKEML